MHCRRAARYFSYVCCLATTVPLLLSCDMLMPSIDNQNDLSAQDQAGLDTDGDGKLDAVEGQGDDDGDGILNFQDANDEDGPAGDLDGDGIVNSQDSNNSNGPVGDPTNSGCVSDRATVPAGDHCTCQYNSCDGTSIDCTCDLTCYAQTNCLINTDANGNPVTGDGTLGTCNLSCTPENDLSTEMTCSASDCQPTPNNTSINPQVNPSAPASTSVNMDRAPQNVGVLFVVDNSGSMQDDQMASACAIDSFFNAASQNGAIYQTGVLTTDMEGSQPSSSATYAADGTYIGPPQLASLAGSCTTTPVCGCGTGQQPTGSTCTFDHGGTMTSSDTAGAEALLKQLIVQGDQGSRNEGGLEQSFQYLAEMERNGTFATQAPKEIIVISDENADADGFLCPFNRVNRNTAGIPNFTPPTPANTDVSCQQDLIDFYIYYFVSRGIIVNGINFTDTCASSSTEEAGNIYLAVIQATGGHVASICQCETFDTFFNDVGQTTSDLSTSLCFDGAVAPDPNSLTVTYTEAGASATVPRSTTNGWSYDASINCIVFAGTWAAQYGSFAVDYIDANAPPPPPTTATACLAAGVDPLLDSIRVSCNGATVPQSSNNGWSFDPVSDCFTFHGTYVNASGCSTEYF